MNNVKKLIKRLIIVCIIIYAVITFFNQQKILNTYASNDAELDKKLVCKLKRIHRRSSKRKIRYVFTK